MEIRVALMPGDGIGAEVTREGRQVLETVAAKIGMSLTLEEAPIGGSAYDLSGDPLPEETLQAASRAQAVLLGAVGGPKWDSVAFNLRPEKGLLRLRSELGLFANLRPAQIYGDLVQASTLKQEVVEGCDLMVVRELTGGIYFGEPRGTEGAPGQRRGFNTLTYTEAEIERIVRVGFDTAAKRRGKLCSVDKANVLDTSMFWREIVTDVARAYPEVALSHMYVDNAAMQLVRAPKQFDVILTGNIFGDILSDEASMLTGSIGMLPSASLDANNKGLYEPCHGSAPDIAGKDIANPLATILSVAMMMRYTFGHEEIAQRIEVAVRKVLQQGLRTADIYEAGMQKVGTVAMGDAIVLAM